MADLSLDDYIQKQNFHIQIQNTNYSPGGNVGITANRNQNNGGSNFQFNKSRGPSITVTGLGNVKSFDARQRIGPKVQFDARQHLQKKKPVDARLKISTIRGGRNSGPQAQGFRQKITGPGSVGGSGIRQRITGPGIGGSNVRQRITGPGSGVSNVRQRITAPGSGDSNVRQRITAPGSGGLNVRQRITAPGNEGSNVRQRITGPGGGGMGVRQRIIGPGTSSGIGQKITAPGHTEGPTLTVKLGSLGHDARKKIISLQTQKGSFDARSRIATKPDNPPQQMMMTGPGNGSQDFGGNVIRNLNPKQSGESGKGTRIQLTDGGLQVTRAIPSASVSFEGSMLTVTKRTQEYQQEEEVAEFEMGNDQYLQDNEFDYYDDDNQLEPDTPEDMKPKLLQIKKTIKTTPLPVTSAPKIVSASLKRKAPPPAPVQSSGPLKLIKPTGGPHIPIIVPQKKAKLTTTPLSKPVVKQPKVFQVKESVEEQVEEEEDVLSPLQGYRVYVTNLHPVVNQDDIIELFGAIGALRKAKLIKQGTAEVVYVKKDDAIKAVQKYHNRELDGLPMQVKLLTSTTATIKLPTTIPAEDDGTQVAKEGPLKLLKQNASAATILRTQQDAESPVELPLVHKALFKLGGQGSSKPVTFTVKI